MPTTLSVLICTYNRAESLRRTLETCRTLVIPKGVSWELIVVDNNSTDCTRQVCDSFAGHLPLRYLFEARQGKSPALNRGVAGSAAPIILFTDDDVDVSPTWVETFLQYESRFPEMGFFGGRVLPHWDAHPPKWLLDNLGWLHTHVHIDEPVEQAFHSGTVPFVVGANLAIRRSVFATGEQFRTDLGPVGTESTGKLTANYDTSGGGRFPGEETEFLQRILRKGITGLYTPALTVYHRHPKCRSTELYLRTYYVQAGMAEIRKEGLAQCVLWFDAPRYLWKTFFVQVLQYCLFRLFSPSRKWLAAERSAAVAWGRITEYRRHHKRTSVTA